MSTPERIQLRRTKGWRMPANTVKVSRPGPFGNPFRVGDRSPQNINVVIDAEHAVQLFGMAMESKEEAGTLEAFIAPLRGKDLACWCPIGSPCHADVLLKIANEAQS